MEGIEAFAARLKAVFGNQEFTAEEVMIELDRTELPPATRMNVTQVGVTASIGKHLAQVPGIVRAHRGRGRTRTTWRLP